MKSLNILCVSAKLLSIVPVSIEVTFILGQIVILICSDSEEYRHILLEDVVKQTIGDVGLVLTWSTSLPKVLLLSCS